VTDENGARELTTEEAAQPIGAMQVFSLRFGGGRDTQTGEPSLAVVINAGALVATFSFRREAAEVFAKALERFLATPRLEITRELPQPPNRAQRRHPG
jgi:hypothetical protein